MVGVAGGATRICAALVLAVAASACASSRVADDVDHVDVTADLTEVAAADLRLIAALVQVAQALPVPAPEPVGDDEGSTDAAGATPRPDLPDAARTAITAAADAARDTGRERLAARLEGLGGAPPVPFELLSDAGDDLVVVTGPDADGPPTWIDVGWVAARNRGWSDALEEGMGRFQRTLPIPPASRRPDDELLARLVTAELVARGGAHRGSVAPGVHLPLDRARLADEPRTDVVWRNVTKAGWYGRRVLPVGQRLFHPDTAARLTARGHALWYATRYAMYQLGPQFVGTAAGPVTHEDWFGELWGPLQIARADVLATRAHDWLQAGGVHPSGVSDEVLVAAVTMAFVAAAETSTGEAPPAHATASSIELGVLVRERALVRTDRGWRLHLSRAREVWADLAERLFTIWCDGDLEDAERLVAGFGTPEPNLRSAIDAVSDLPPWRGELRMRVLGLP